MGILVLRFKCLTMDGVRLCTVLGEVVEEAGSVQGCVCLFSSILGGRGEWCQGWRKVSCLCGSIDCAWSVAVASWLSVLRGKIGGAYSSVASNDFQNVSVVFGIDD